MAYNPSIPPGYPQQGYPPSTYNPYAQPGTNNYQMPQQQQQAYPPPGGYVPQLQSYQQPAGNSAYQNYPNYDAMQPQQGAIPQGYQTVQQTPSIQQTQTYGSPTYSTNPYDYNNAQNPNTSNNYANTKGNGDDGVQYAYTAGENAHYSYDPNNIQYQAMTVDQWGSIPADQTQYSQYWSDSSSFEPETFSKNVKEQTKWNDLGWLIAFWINFVAFIVVFAIVVIKGRENWDLFFYGGGSYYPYQYSSNTNSAIHLKFNQSNWESLSVKEKEIQYLKMIQKQKKLEMRIQSEKSQKSDYYYDDDDDYYHESTTFNTKVIQYTVGFGFAIAIVINIIHGVYVTLAPVFYIKFGFVMIVIVALLCCVPAFLLKVYPILIFPAIVILLVICCYCCIKKKIPLSAAMLKQACTLLWKNPTIFIVMFIELIIEIIVSIMFVFAVLFVVISDWSYWIYIYFLLAFFWITFTFGYVVYLTTAGVAAQWYFLHDTEYMPKMAVWASFKRAVTTSFGSASLAGFLMAVVNVCKAIANDARSQGGIIALIACIAYCILLIIECFLAMITRFALIYCATFGVPFKEGCRRWTELETKQFVGTLLNSCIISTALGMNMFVFCVGAAVLGFGVGYIFMPHNIYLLIFLPVASLLFTLCMFSVLETPIETLADTLFVCFVERPENLKTTANELYEKLVDAYGSALEAEIQIQNSSKQ
ncbi:hypothetical protein TRFO_34479 [Tritrichomonas foetus]|uniref:Choline transporter-like protein n=1 Tax=Tritrichomonas foetus TaxID=1144522 RepID=A0A1J4JJ00_9EUKA|nr:hypothetical protein TRFO_34479 [Tritrichomonas foetus]|eukprot:OHS99160.1 hypothetical protein TRFO_34479 [Tritrichomonas foetus]